MHYTHYSLKENSLTIDTATVQNWTVVQKGPVWLGTDPGGLASVFCVQLQCIRTQESLQPPSCWPPSHPWTRRRTASASGPALPPGPSRCGPPPACQRLSRFSLEHTCRWWTKHLIMWIEQQEVQQVVNRALSYCTIALLPLLLSYYCCFTDAIIIVDIIRIYFLHSIVRNQVYYIISHYIA